MVFKINISDKGKTFKLETDTEFLEGKKIGERIDGIDLLPDLKGYELEITGASDRAGFPAMKELEGIGLKKMLLKRGWGMKKKQKGLRLRKSVRGNTISQDIVQINMNVIKSGEKRLEKIFAGQVKREAREGKEKKKEEKERVEEEVRKGGKEEKKAEGEGEKEKAEEKVEEKAGEEKKAEKLKEEKPEEKKESEKREEKEREESKSEN